MRSFQALLRLEGLDYTDACGPLILSKIHPFQQAAERLDYHVHQTLKHGITAFTAY